MRTANGGEDNEEVNGDLQSESNELAWVNDINHNSNSSSNSINNNNNNNFEEENINNNNYDFIEDDINGDLNNNGEENNNLGNNNNNNFEENNNNIEIEVNNNYQALDNTPPPPIRRPQCTGCDCNEINYSKQRIASLEDKPYQPNCVCIKGTTWNAEEQCCFCRRIAPLPEPTRKFLCSESDTDSDVVIVGEILKTPEPAASDKSSLLGKRTHTPDPDFLRAKRPKNPKKRFSALTLGPLSKQKPPAKRQHCEDKENDDVVVPVKRTKSPQDICFVECNKSSSTAVGVEPEFTGDPLVVPTKAGAAGPSKKRPADPLAKLSLSSREQRIASDSSKMYEPPPLHTGLAATGYYSSKLNSHDEAGGAGTSSTSIGANSTSTASNQNLLDSNKTIATLCNIGNSCYLNSVVYTLRFAPLFLHKLHHLIEDMATIYIKLNPMKHKSSSLGRNVSLWQGNSGRSWSSKDLASLGSISTSDGLPRNNRLVRIIDKLFFEFFSKFFKLKNEQFLR